MAEITLQRKTKPDVSEIIREGLIGALGAGLITLFIKRITAGFFSSHFDWGAGFRVMLSMVVTGLIIGLLYVIFSRILAVKPARFATWIATLLLMICAMLFLPPIISENVNVNEMSPFLDQLMNIRGMNTLRVQLMIMIAGLVSTFTATQA